MRNTMVALGLVTLLSSQIYGREPNIELPEVDVDRFCEFIEPMSKDSVSNVVEERIVIDLEDDTEAISLLNSYGDISFRKDESGQSRIELTLRGFGANAAEAKENLDQLQYGYQIDNGQVFLIVDRESYYQNAGFNWVFYNVEKKDITVQGIFSHIEANELYNVKIGSHFGATIIKRMKGPAEIALNVGTMFIGFDTDNGIHEGHIKMSFGEATVAIYKDSNPSTRVHLEMGAWFSQMELPARKFQFNPFPLHHYQSYGNQDGEVHANVRSGKIVFEPDFRAKHIAIPRNGGSSAFAAKALCKNRS